ncbi:endonuclease/exonuclease/phosphatase family protein [Paenibacillus sp. GCM10027626]|uniref:endonuclease/exonuclease/phosphatase family protein n=1 Tax=Paenibacillus sp. GCM10027626 TaxID=3273411 RepID=UPI003632D06E
MFQSETIKIMTLNTWHGGEDVNYGINKILKAVELSGADIVGFQEIPDPGKEAAEKLGWYYYQNQEGRGNCSIISKYPIIEAFHIDGISAVAALIRLPSGQQILVADTHLYHDPYGPYWAIFDRKSNEEIIMMENEVRARGMSIVLRELMSYMASDIPVFLMGDFNTPSHLDWGDDTKSVHDGRIIEWPVSVLAEGAGLIDSYRAIHPDPVASPGHTWSPVHTPEHPWGDIPHEPQDRIDFIYFRGGRVEVVNSEVFVVGNPQGYGSHEDNEWPSDHAAVISTFLISVPNA